MVESAGVEEVVQTFHVEEIVESLGVLRLQPGDLLAVICKVVLSHSSVDYLQGYFRDRVPEGVHVVILGKDLTLARVTAGGDDVSS